MMLAKTLAHPYLEYGQAAIAEPTATAEDIIRRAYNRTARMATRKDRSAAALKEAGWMTWDEKRGKITTDFVTKIRNSGEPAVLSKLIPGELTGQMETRAIRRGEVYEPAIHTEIGRKAFAIWAEEAVNEEKSRQEKAEQTESYRSRRKEEGKGVAEEDEVDEEEHATAANLKEQQNLSNALHTGNSPA